MDGKISKYRVAGKTYCWKYLENYSRYPGWNLTVSKEAAQSLSQLLLLMWNSEFPSRKEFPLSVPGEKQLHIPNNNGGMAKFRYLKTLLVNYRKFDQSHLWEVLDSKDKLEIKFGSGKLREFCQAIERLKNGEGDFAISDNFEKNILYFWWNLER